MTAIDTRPPTDTRAVTTGGAVALAAATADDWAARTGR